MKSQEKVNHSVFPSFTDVTDVGNGAISAMPAAVILYALRFLKKVLTEILQQLLSLLDMHFWLYFLL